MHFKLILGAVSLLAALVFSVQNAGVVNVRFLPWTFSTSLALVIFGALAAGLIGGIRRFDPGWPRRNFTAVASWSTSTSRNINRLPTLIPLD